MPFNPRPNLLAVLFLPAFLAGPVHGQASIGGVVVEVGTRRPVAGALVLMDSTREAVTDAEGRFRFISVAEGSRMLDIHHIAYAERRDSLAVRDGEHVELVIQMAVEAIALAPLSIDIRSQRLLGIGFYERAARGIGIHISGQELRESKATRLGDFLARVPGVRRAMVNGDFSRIDMRGGKSLSQPCDTQFFLDGTAMAAGAAVLDHLTPLDVDGIEIYRGASETPSQFDFGRTSCGAIVIWTRQR